MWSLALLLLVQTAVFGFGSYRFEVVAQTGDRTAAGNTITNLGTGPSINDSGQVAYIVTIQDGRQGVFASGESVAPSWRLEDFEVYPGTTVRGLSSAFRFGDVLQINNSGQIAWRAAARDGQVSFIFRLGSKRDDFRIVAKTHWSYLTTLLLSPFRGPGLLWWEGLSPQVSLNNPGRTVFSAIPRWAPRFKLIATPRSPENSDHDSLDDYHYYSFEDLEVFLDKGELAPRLFPLVADNDRTVLRRGHSSESPIVVFADATLDYSTAFMVATPADFHALGQAPGISDDGEVVAYMGDHKTKGRGIYISILFEYGFSEPIKVAGAEDGFRALALEPRVGVNRSGRGIAGEYTLAYMAFGPEGKLGLYTTATNLAPRPLQHPVVETCLVAEEGDEIEGLPGRINDIKIYDPINNKGQLAFWASTSAGGQAIVRTRAPLLESFDANPHFTYPYFLPFEEPSEYLLQYLADFEPFGFSDEQEKQVNAIVADGVSLLLLRTTIPEPVRGEVTFTLEHSLEGSLGSVGTVWSVDDVSLCSQAGDRGDWDFEAPAGDTAVSVEVFVHDGKAYAFALYRAPRNFDWDESAISGAASSERVRPVTIRANFSPSSSAEHRGAMMQKDIYVVRPPVLLVHGTWDRPSGWDDFPLWKGSANAQNGFSSLDSDYPFTVFRLDYEANNAGRLETNARLILPQIEDAVGRFRTCGAFQNVGIHRVAATQADIVTHSYGGPIVRKASQIQSHPYSAGTDTPPADGRNFRTDSNWGYGYIHKLITLSGTHKGSQMAPHTARVNALSGGKINELAIKRATTGYPFSWPIFVSENRIDCGALADQNVVSEALQLLKQTIYPSHAVVGSGLYERSVPSNASTFWIVPLEDAPFCLFWWLMMGDLFDFSEEAVGKRNGPYALGSGSVNPFDDLTTARRLVNYVFNLDHDEGAQPNTINPLPWSAEGGGDAPNYDLTARLSSMRGGLEGDAVTDVRHLDPDGSASDAFVGQLTHLTEIGGTAVAIALANKIAFLLRQSAASKYFARFPAVEEIIDEFDRMMIDNFPQDQVEAELLVYPPDLQVPPCFEDEVRVRLERGENGLDIIQTP
jgi:hypothetical protein